MADIALERKHRLGLPRARELAWQWAEQVEQSYGMECTVEEGDDEDLVRFTRSGVHGELRVTGAVFELRAKLGLLVGAFRGQIQAEVEKKLDELLAKEAKPAKAASKKAAPKKR